MILTAKNITAAEKTLGFQISHDGGIVWPHTGGTGKSITAATREKRIAAMSRHFGLKSTAGLYIKE